MAKSLSLSVRASHISHLQKSPVRSKESSLTGNFQPGRNFEKAGINISQNFPILPLLPILSNPASTHHRKISTPLQLSCPIYLYSIISTNLRGCDMFHSHFQFPGSGTYVPAHQPTKNGRTHISIYVRYRHTQRFDFSDDEALGGVPKSPVRKVFFAIHVENNSEKKPPPFSARWGELALRVYIRRARRKTKRAAYLGFGLHFPTPLPEVCRSNPRKTPPGRGGGGVLCMDNSKTPLI